MYNASVVVLQAELRVIQESINISSVNEFTR